MKKAFYLLTISALAFSAIWVSSPQADSFSAGSVFDRFTQKASYDRLNQVLYYLHNQYVDPSRIDFSKMFSASVKELSLSIAELSYVKSNKKTMTVSVMDFKKEFSLKISSIYALRNQLSDLLSFVDQNKKTKLEHLSVEEVAIQGLLDTLDPHTVFLSKEVLQETNIDIEGNFGGLGIVIGFRDGHLTVISPIDGTPASRAGIQAGDRIVKINKEPTTGMTLTEAVSKMRGLKGTAVTISVVREGIKKSMPYKIVRDTIEIINIDSALLAGDIGYVKLKRFDKSAANDIAYAIQNMQAMAGRNLQGVIFDMRNNPGGLLDQAIEVSDLFLEKGDIVSTVERSNRKGGKARAKKSTKDFLYPMVVLINQGSASASEIVAGALQKNNRALLIGQKTFGKGTVQKIYELPKQTALKITVSKYLTVDDISIQSIGINPDIETQPVWIKDNEIRFYDLLKIRTESTLDRHFSNIEKTNLTLSSLSYLIPQEDEDDTQLTSVYSFSKLAPAEKQKKLFEIFEVKLAHEILSTPRVKELNRTELFDNAKSTIAKVELEKQKEIQEALLKEGVDWTYPPKPTTYCNPKDLSIKTSLPKGIKSFQDGADIKLTTHIKNNAACTFYQVKSISTSENPVFDQHFVFIGKVGPKEEIEVSSTLEIPESQSMGVEMLNFKSSDAQGATLGQETLQIPFQAPQKPRFKVHYQTQKEPSSRSLRFDIENIGNQASDELLFLVKQKGDKTLVFESARQVIENLKPGQKSTVSIPLKYANPSAPKKPAVLTFQFADIENRVFLEKTFTVDQSDQKGVIQAPMININPLIATKVSDKKQITLEGVVSDDSLLKDMYIFVNEEKIYFHAFSQKKKQQTFSVPIPLEKEENTIQIISRDQYDVQGGTEVHILRNM